MRVFGCVCTKVPGDDGIAYLWMAEQWAKGDLGGLFQTVFHPLYPFLIGLLLRLWPGLDVVLAGQLVASLCGALAIVPLWFVAKGLFGERAAWWAGIMYAIGNWYVRHPANCMSEGPFYLLAAAWAWAVLRSRLLALLAGACAGLAFLARPEGALLAAAAGLYFGAHRRWSQAAAVAVAAVLLGALLPLGFLCTGHGFTLTPKALYNWQVGAGGSDSPVGFYLRQWLSLPGDAWEGLGYLVLPLMLAGGICWRPRRLV